MEALLLERMRNGLLQKQDNLTKWLHATPLSKKKVLLGYYSFWGGRLYFPVRCSISIHQTVQAATTLSG